MGPARRSFAAPGWFRRQLTGGVIFYVAIFLVVGSLRHVTLG
jgi:hypothetical protein